jgi:hypothetical protein
LLVGGHKVSRICNIKCILLIETSVVVLAKYVSGCKAGLLGYCCMMLKHWETLTQWPSITSQKIWKFIEKANVEAENLLCTVQYAIMNVIMNSFYQ